ncbi:MAG: PIN domain-containing protein [Chloroflexota bacterium]|nr:PIN domain-containing protein [Chloroflexota bacterium]
MTLPYIDTDVIICLLTGDDSVKQAAASVLFEDVEKGSLTVAAPDTVIADAVYVLASPRLYNLSRAQVTALLTPLAQLTHFRVQNRRNVLEALRLYGTTAGLEFGDALLVATMQQDGSKTLYSYDHHFDRIATIQRREP